MPHETVTLEIQLTVQVEVNDIQQVKEEQLKHVHVRTVIDERGGNVEQLLFPPWENHVTQMICDRVNGHIPYPTVAELVQTAEQAVPEPGYGPRRWPSKCRVAVSSALARCGPAIPSKDPMRRPARTGHQVCRVPQHMGHQRLGSGQRSGR